MVQLNIPNDLTTTSQLYDFIGKTIHDYIPKSVVVLNQLDEKLNRSYVYSLTGLNSGLFNKLNSILGLNPVGKKYRNIPDGDKFYFNLTEFRKYNKTLYHFAGGQLPEWVCKSIETFFNLKEIWCIGLTHNNTPFGSVMIFSRTTGTDLKSLEPFIHEASQRLSQLIQQNQSLLNIPDQKNEFTQAIIRNISHEIRTPLNGILGMLEISEAYINTNEQERQELISSIWTNARTLTRTIENMVMASELEANMSRFLFDIQTINQLADLTLSIINRIQRTVPNRQITLSIAPELPIAISELYIDRHKIEYVIEELLFNALKFSDEEIKIIIATDNESLKVSVQDNGIGMNEKEQQLVFKHFTKIDKEDKLYRGIGLGLSNSNEIIIRHMGNVIIESNQGEGTVVSFFLPMYRDVRQQLKIGTNFQMYN